MFPGYCLYKILQSLIYGKQIIVSMTKYISALQSSLPVLFGMMLLGRRAAPENKDKIAVDLSPPAMKNKYFGEIIIMSSSKIGEAKSWEYQ
jgi:hypothetical protein